MGDWQSMKRLALSAVLLLTACGAAPPPASDPAPGKANLPAAVDAGAAPSSAPVAATVPAPVDLPAPSDVAAPPADAAKTTSGLATRVLAPGTGKDHPGPRDQVEVHYSGWTASGKMFDSSVARKEPIKLGVNDVIPGWTEALQLMVVGEKRRLWIPADLAYGQHPRDQGAPAGALTFDVELLSLIPAPKPPETPKDVKAPPKTAKKRPSGLAYRILNAGPGKGPSPLPSTKVKVHYTGWTTDGKMFDSSVARGQPAIFEPEHLIAGLTEGIPLMKAGDTYRFWIPAKLAYGVKPTRADAPKGLLVFDVELIGIEE